MYSEHGGPASLQKGAGNPIISEKELLSVCELTSWWSRLPVFWAGRHCADRQGWGSRRRSPQTDWCTGRPHTWPSVSPERTEKEKDISIIFLNITEVFKWKNINQPLDKHWASNSERQLLRFSLLFGVEGKWDKWEIRVMKSRLIDGTRFRRFCVLIPWNLTVFLLCDSLYKVF